MHVTLSTLATCNFDENCLQAGTHCWLDHRTALEGPNPILLQYVMYEWHTNRLNEGQNQTSQFWTIMEECAITHGRGKSTRP